MYCAEDQEESRLGLLPQRGLSHQLHYMAIVEVVMKATIVILTSRAIQKANASIKADMILPRESRWRLIPRGGLS